jgi:hypothetical protein
MMMSVHAGFWWLRLSVLLLVVTFGFSHPAASADRTNVPLKNWGGFAVHRHAVYDDLERLVTAGLVDGILLSTKPLSRLEAARAVARAVETIRQDEARVWDARRDLEPVLDRLIAEFRVELAALGVRVGEAPVAAPGLVVFVPVDRARVQAGYAGRHGFRFVNERGLAYDEGFNGIAAFDSRLQVGDFLSVYLEPELHGSEESLSLRLRTGYLKLTLFNVELLVGRESLWWGPALRGSMILSNNAPALDQIRIGAAEPFRLPLVGRWLGPTKLLFFVAQLEAEREDPRARLAGMRGTIAPFRFLEIGISRTFMFGGRTPPRPGVGDFFRLLVDPRAGNEPDDRPERRANNLFAIDADLRLANVDRWRLPARDLRIYGELGFDDVAGPEHFYRPARRSFLLGAHLIGVFGQEGLEARGEYAKTSRLGFTHHQFTDGYTLRGRVISHYVGTDAEDWYARATNRITRDVMLGIELNRARLGLPDPDVPGGRQRRLGGGADVSWRFLDVYSLFTQFQVFDVTNRGFRAGDDGIEYVVRMEVTRSFR